MGAAAQRVSRRVLWNGRLRQLTNPVSRVRAACDALCAFAKTHPDQRAARAACERVVRVAMTEMNQLARGEPGDQSSHRK
jgi:hypothetical protein